MNSRLSKHHQRKPAYLQKINQSTTAYLMTCEDLTTQLTPEDLTWILTEDEEDFFKSLGNEIFPISLNPEMMELLLPKCLTPKDKAILADTSSDAPEAPSLPADVVRTEFDARLREIKAASQKTADTKSAPSAMRPNPINTDEIPYSVELGTKGSCYVEGYNKRKTQVVVPDLIDAEEGPICRIGR